MGFSAINEPLSTLYRVYMLEAMACSGRVTVHVGIAVDVGKRIYEHSRGRVRATRGREIHWLGNTAPMPRGDALRLEAALKKKSSMEKRTIATAWPEHSCALNKR